MNRNELLNTVSTRYRSLAATIRNDNTSEMHLVKTFRKEVKFLRAFFILLEIETNGAVQFTLSKKICQVYNNLAFIGKLHFHLKNIKTLCENSSLPVPVFYVKRIEQDLNSWKDRVKKFQAENYDFDKDEKLIISLIPNELKMASVKKFLEYSFYELQRLHHFNNDESLQNIKKLLEDVSYNWQFIQPYTNILPKGFMQLSQINEWIKMLADLHKNSIDMALLRVHYSDFDDEKEVLKSVERKLTAYNDSLRQNIFDKLKGVDFDKIADKKLEGINGQYLG